MNKLLLIIVNSRHPKKRNAYYIINGIAYDAAGLFRVTCPGENPFSKTTPAQLPEQNAQVNNSRYTLCSGTVQYCIEIEISKLTSHPIIVLNDNGWIIIMMERYCPKVLGYSSRDVLFETSDDIIMLQIPNLSRYKFEDLSDQLYMIPLLEYDTMLFNQICDLIQDDDPLSTILGTNPEINNVNPKRIQLIQ